MQPSGPETNEAKTLRINPFQVKTLFRSAREGPKHILGTVQVRDSDLEMEVVES